MSEEIRLGSYKGMSQEESIKHQLDEWTKGNPTHNPIRDECCPDFSCCTGKIADQSFRDAFKRASEGGDDETIPAMLMSSLGKLIADSGASAHLVGEDPTEH